MSDLTESANLILRLYELRREEVMRKARAWYSLEFNPGSAQEVAAAALGEHSAYFRMVTSYWEMAASFVVNGAINEQMFNDANGEHLVVFGKVAPFINEVREISGRPNYMEHLEKVVMNLPNATERMTSVRELLKRIAAGQAAKA